MHMHVQVPQYSCEVRREIAGVGSPNVIWVTWVSGKCPYPLRHLADCKHILQKCAEFNLVSAKIDASLPEWLSNFPTSLYACNMSKQMLSSSTKVFQTFQPCICPYTTIAIKSSNDLNSELILCFRNMLKLLRLKKSEHNKTQTRNLC